MHNGEISTPCEFCKQQVTWFHPDEFKDVWLTHYLECSVIGKFTKRIFGEMRAEMHQYVKETLAKIFAPES